MTQRKKAPRKGAGKPAAKRGPRKGAGTKKGKQAATKLRSRRAAALFGFMLLLSGLLLWGVIEISRYGTTETTPNVAGGGHDESHETGITDADKRRLKELLETIENERAKK